MMQAGISRLVLLVSSMVFVSQLMVSGGSVAAIYTTAQINARLPSGTATAKYMDWDYCHQNLLTTRNFSSATRPDVRSAINGVGAAESASYVDLAWLSGDNMPNVTSPVDVTYGQTSVPLQINAVTFLCGPLVTTDEFPGISNANNSQANYDRILDDSPAPTRWVKDATNANDRAPNAIGSNVMQPARVDTTFRIQGYSVISGSGTVSGGVGSYMTRSRDNTSRYWFADPTKVTYNAPIGGITTDTEVIIRMDYKLVTGYHNYPSKPGREERCVKDGVSYGATDIPRPFAVCDIRSSTLRITLHPIARPPTGGYTIASSCSTGLTLTADDPDIADPIQLRARVVIDGDAATATEFSFTDGGTLNRPVIKDFGSHTYDVTILGKNGAGAEDGVDLALPQQQVGPCLPATVACQSVNTTIANPEPGQLFGFSVGVSYGGGSIAAGPTRPRYKMAVSMSPSLTNFANTADAPYVNQPSSTNTTATVYSTAVAISGDAGVYTVTWRFIDTTTGAVLQAPNPCRGTITIAAKPYVHVYNGDASGTATFTCGVSSTGSLRAYNKGSAGGYAGSGAQIATLAASVIDGFTSASMRAASPLKPTGLAFANTSGAYGGNFAQTPCVSDFWATAPSLPALGYSVNGTVSPGHYSSPGGGTTVANPGTSYILYANGDVYLNGDTKFAGGGASWNANNLPYFWLIVKGGNIYIKNSVAQLDGVYVSIPNGGAGGKIYTCSVDNGAGGLRAPTAAEMSAGCGTQLRINGAFVANEVKLLRTANTLRASAAGETAATSRAAEVFTYTPEMWLRSPIPTATGGTGKYDAYSSLPPVL